MNPKELFDKNLKIAKSPFSRAHEPGSHIFLTRVTTPTVIIDTTMRIFNYYITTSATSTSTTAGTSGTAGLNSLALGGVLFLIAMYTLIFKKRSSEEAKQEESDRPWPKVPGALPIIGNLIPGGFENSTSTIESWAREYGSETGVFECNIFGQKLIVLCQEEKIASVEKHRPFGVTRRQKLNNVLDGLGFKGLFSAEGDNWRTDRRLVAPQFQNRNHVRDYVDAVKLVASRLVEKFGQTMKKDGVVTINSDINCFTLDVISLVAYTIDMDTLRKDDLADGISRQMQTLMGGIFHRIFCPIPYWKIPIVGYYMDGMGAAFDSLSQTIRGIIDEHESVLLAKGQSGQNSQGEQEDFVKRSKSFLGKMLLQGQANKFNSTLTQDRLIGNILTIFFAGADTSRSALCTCLYHIAADETGLQDELAAEILTVTDLEGKAGLDDLNDGLPRLRSLVYEVLRLYGPAPLMGAENTIPIELDGIVLPPKTSFLFLLSHPTTVQATTDVTNERIPRGMMDAPPDRFCPRRWIIEAKEEGEGKAPNRKKKSVIAPTFKNGYRAFGSGMRVCPGRGLAEIEMLVCLSFLLGRFEMKLQEGHPPLSLGTKFIQCPVSDIKLVLCERNR